MNVRLRTGLTVAALALSCINQAHAQGIPVYDNAQNLNQLQELAHMVKQLKQMEREYEAMTGNRGMGTFLNGSIEADMRRYAPDDLSDLLNIMQASGLPASTTGVRGAYSSLYNDTRPVTAQDLNPYDPAYPSAKAYERKVNTTFAALAATEGAYDNVSRRTSTYEAMLNELDRTPDMKASIDLQTRANIENGMVLNELTRILALQTQLLASQSNQELADTRAVYDAQPQPSLNLE